MLTSKRNVEKLEQNVHHSMSDWTAVTSFKSQLLEELMMIEIHAISR